MRATAQARHYLWTEQKVAAQFSKSFQDFADAEAARKRLLGWQPPADIADALKAPSQRASWQHMERVEVEPWFRHEAGDDGDPAWMTKAELEADNKRRALDEATRLAVLDQ